MANDFFNVSGNPLDHTTGVSSVIRAEFAAIAAGFSALQVTPNLGAPTGVTATPGDASTKLATTAFVSATAFSAALPGQTSNNGKFLTTNGTAASWVFIGGGATPHTSAVDITLTDELTHIHPCNFTVNDKSVMLPDATTLSVGCAYTFTATGNNGFYVRDSTGRYIHYVDRLKVVTTTLADKSSAAGVWISSVANMPEQSTGPEFFVNALASTAPLVIMLTATTAIILYAGASGFLSAKIATTTANTDNITFGGLNTLNAINSNNIVGYAISSTSVLCLFKNVTTGFINGVTLTVSGNTVTANTNYVLSATAWGNYSLAKLTATQGVFMGTNAGNNASCFTVNIAGTVITIGAVLVLNALTTTYTAICFLSTTTAVVAYYETATPRSAMNVITVSGTTCSAGANFATSTNNFTQLGLCYLQAGYFALVGSGATPGNGAYINFYSVSGTTIAANSINQRLSYNGAVSRCNCVLLDVAHGYGIKLFVAYQDTDATIQGLIVWHIPGVSNLFGGIYGINWSTCSLTSLAALTANRVIAVCIDATFVAATLTDTSAAV